MKPIVRMGIVVALALSLASHCVLGQAPAPGKAPSAKPGPAPLEKATFAGGCFWCMQGEFEELPGVKSVVAGYTGGTTKNPTYEQVSSGGTGHFESVEITFDPSKISYDRILDTYWHNVDPFTPYGQFCDRGEQYRTAIFVHDPVQRNAAEASKQKIEQAAKKKVVTLILPASTFWPAEEYHQDYAKKNPFRYGLYRKGCGRDELLEQIWGTQPKEKP